jgi:hypothetical protein
MHSGFAPAPLPALAYNFQEQTGIFASNSSGFQCHAQADDSTAPLGWEGSVDTYVHTHNTAPFAQPAHSSTPSL